MAQTHVPCNGEFLTTAPPGKSLEVGILDPLLAYTTHPAGRDRSFFAPHVASTAPQEEVASLLLGSGESPDSPLGLP